MLLLQYVNRLPERHRVNSFSSDFCFFGVRTKHSLGFLIKLLSFGSVTNIYALKWLFGHSAHRIHPHSYCKWRLNPYQSMCLW